MACHDKANPSWWLVMTKVKVYTLRGDMDIAPVQRQDIVLVWKPDVALH